MAVLDTIALLADWLGDNGEPVHPMVAEFRAQRCLSGDNGNPCPNHREPHWWERHSKEPIAQVIKEQLMIKHHMNLNLVNNDELAMCGACGCCLQLKVWVPRHHLIKHTSKPVLDKMPGFCWIKKELSL